jgi:hypothetical protein
MNTASIHASLPSPDVALELEAANHIHREQRIPSQEGLSTKEAVPNPHQGTASQPI